MTMTTDMFVDELNKMFGSNPIRNAVANDGVPRKDWARHLKLIKELKYDQDENYVHKEDALEYVMDNMGDDWITDTDIYQDLLMDNQSLGDQDKELKKEREELRKEIEVNRVALGAAVRARAENSELRKEVKDLKEHYDKTTSEEHGWFNAIAAKKFEELNQFKEEVIDATQLDDGLEDHEYIDYIKEMEEWVDVNDIAQYWTTPLYEEIATIKKKATDAAFRSARQIQRLKKKISELEGSK